MTELLLCDGSALYHDQWRVYVPIQSGKTCTLKKEKSIMSRYFCSSVKTYY